MSYGYEMYSVGNIVNNYVIFLMVTYHKQTYQVISYKCIEILNPYVV